MTDPRSFVHQLPDPHTEELALELIAPRARELAVRLRELLAPPDDIVSDPAFVLVREGVELVAAPGLTWMVWEHTRAASMIDTLWLRHRELLAVLPVPPADQRHGRAGRVEKFGRYWLGLVRAFNAAVTLYHGSKPRQRAMQPFVGAVAAAVGPEAITNLVTQPELLRAVVAAVSVVDDAMPETDEVVCVVRELVIEVARVRDEIARTVPQ